MDEKTNESGEPRIFTGPEYLRACLEYLLMGGIFGFVVGFGMGWFHL